MNKTNYKLGIDVGGTNTDVVLLDANNQVTQSLKTATTEDLETGIYNGVKSVVENSKVDTNYIDYVSIGTTHAINAIIRRKGLLKTAVVRVCLPAGQGVPPLYTWEKDLIDSMNATFYYIKGGSEFDGRPLAGTNIDRDECLEILKELKNKNYEALVVSSIFSPVNSGFEKEFSELAKEVLGQDFPVTLSSEIGSLGLLERENSAALNAAVIGIAHSAIKGLESSLSKLGINAKMYFSQNDGTLMSLEYAIKYPILTIGSGATNSIRGAAYLSGYENCIVVDIGGTSTDVGILVNKFPRQSSASVEVGGVKTNFRMPDLISIGLGGGSIVTRDGDDIKIGPDSVGYRIYEDSIPFGGETLTATDIALAAGIAEINDPRCDVSRLDYLEKEFVDKAVNQIIQMVLNECERISTSSNSLPIVLVGGGSILFPEGARGEVLKPENFGCANAIGAAIADASGEVDGLWPLEGTSREAAIEEAKAQAIDKAIEMGAKENEIEIVDMEAIPLTYLPGNIVRCKVKAAGPIDF